jgi:hypothetical protein
MQVDELAAIPPRNVLCMLKFRGMSAGRNLTVPTHENRLFFYPLYFFCHASHFNLPQR